MVQPAILQREEGEEIKVKTEKTKRKRVPKELIYEMRHGKPIYYRDYDKVLSGEKTLEEVMGSSKLQAFIIMLIVEHLLKVLNQEKYLLLFNELGFKFAPRGWRNLDIAIFEKKDIEKNILEDKYTEVPPQVVIEIDTKADLRKYGDIVNYITEKTDDLLNAGVHKVIWILSRTKKIMVAEKDKVWHIYPWNNEIEILEGIKLNLELLLKKF